MEINWFAHLTKMTVREVLEDMIDGGPGQPARRRGGDFSPGGPRQDLRAQGRRAQLDRDPPHGARAGAAVELPRCSTGTSKTPYHRVDHLVRLRELQDETGGFQTFIPLAFHPDNTGLAPHQKAVGTDGPADDGGEPADARQL